MQIEDIKKLLKKITWFDYAALSILFLVLVISFLFFYRRAEIVDVRVKVTDQQILYAWNYPQNWYADRFEIGAVERDALGRVITEITDVEKYNINSDHQAVFLDLKVRATYDTRTKLYYARGKPLVFGTPVRFNLSSITFDGVVISSPGSPDNIQTEEKNIYVVARGIREDDKKIEPQVMEAIEVGDTLENSRGDTLVEVTAVQTRSALRIVTDDNGIVYQRQDPFYKDALINLKVQTKELNGNRYILDDVPLRIGEDLPLSFKNKYLETEIIDVEQD